MKVPRQKENAGEFEPVASRTSGNGSDLAAASEPQSLAIERSDLGGLADSKATGPRTEQGKQKSSRNATKYGIFSNFIIIKGESSNEYEKLLTGLRENLQPEGTLKELLLEKLASLAWRQRRLLLAEGAEVRKNMAFFESDQRDREREESERIASLSNPLSNPGLIRNIQDPDVLEYCQELPFQLRRHVNERGFDPKFDKRILGEIYGVSVENHLREDLYDAYENWLATSETPEEERLRKGYVLPTQCRMNFLRILDKEIVRLRHDHEARGARTQLETMCRNVPDSPAPRSPAPLRSEPRPVFRPKAKSARTLATNAIGPTSFAQGRGAPFAVLMMSDVSTASEDENCKTNSSKTLVFNDLVMAECDENQIGDYHFPRRPTTGISR